MMIRNDNELLIYQTLMHPLLVKMSLIKHFYSKVPSRLRKRCIHKFHLFGLMGRACLIRLFFYIWIVILISCNRTNLFISSSELYKTSNTLATNLLPFSFPAHTNSSSVRWADVMNISPGCRKNKICIKILLCSLRQFEAIYDHIMFIYIILNLGRSILDSGAFFAERAARRRK